MPGLASGEAPVTHKNETRKNAGKKKQKSAKSSKSAKLETAKLPKRIAGIKVPKELRGPGGKLLEAVRHPLVMDVAAAALMAAAASLRHGKAPPAAPGAEPRDKPATDLGALITATALEGVRRLGDAAVRRHDKGNGNDRNSGNGASEGGTAAS
jgi:hypothetical protein